MKKNTFYLVVGCIALALLGIFWYSVEVHDALVIEAAFVLAIIIVYFARKKVTDLIEDERSAKITEKAALRTFQVFWVLFCAFSIGAVMNMLFLPRLPRTRLLDRSNDLAPLEIMPLRIVGYIQLGLLCLMIFLYVGFRLYYARQYGDWETDEE
jgi:uncharacterized membrane protein